MYVELTRTVDSVVVVIYIFIDGVDLDAKLHSNGIGSSPEWLL